MTPVVSICIPAYRQPSLLERTISSVLRQNFADFEIIVTDDSDDDAVFNMLQQWKDESRLRYYRNASRLGSPENWNEALRYARSDLIKFMHHDDWFAHESALGVFASALRDNPSINFAFSAAYACEDDGSIIFLHKPSEQQIAALRHSPSELLFRNFIGPPSSTIFRKSNFAFDNSLQWVVDIDAYMCHLEDNPSFVYLPDALINVSSNGAHQVTRQLVSKPELRISESLYLYTKHRPNVLSNRLRGIRDIFNLIRSEREYVLLAVTAKRSMQERSLEEKIIFFARKVTWKLRSLYKNLFRNKDLHKLSYSQCGEDCIIDFLFMWLGISEVRYLDIGAHHPTWLSNTYFFYRKGNRGVLIEPDEDLCGSLLAKRPGDTVLNVAVGLSGKDTIPMYVMASRTLNTLDRHQAETLQASGDNRIEAVRDVERIGINLLLEEHFKEKGPNFVSLDVEGLDLPILQAWDFSRFRPEVFCVETLTYSRNNTEKKLPPIIEYMESNGYKLYADTFINSIFVDTNAWGKRPIYKN